MQGAELPGTADCSVSTKALINQSSESVVLSYRPPRLTDDDGTGALDAVEFRSTLKLSSPERQLLTPARNIQSTSL